ncbi:NAD(P)H-dependent flavin oxidoreductase [Marinobacter sp.]|uniref:NAD(P)H-dependent flavin oxidoreductase n=1 Tax=Marinobacter sp. TaxID=50741 RepID=UPI00384A8843
MATHMTALPGIDYPIIQAPMAGVSTPELAAVVSDAGALGSISVGAATPGKAREMIADTRALTIKPFNVNVFCHQPATLDAGRETRWLTHLKPFFEAFGATPPTGLREIYQSFVTDPEMLQVLLDEKPAFVSFHFGLPPASHIQALHDAGIHLLACATTVEEGRRIEQAGVDAIVAQGLEAGGHRGMFRPALGDPGLHMEDLVRSLSESTRIPVIAAGGIMDGHGIVRAIRAGACAAQLGTAFVLCPESSANGGYRQALMDARPGGTQITAAISGRPARGLINRMHHEVGVSTAPDLPDYPVAYDAAKALHRAASKNGSEEFAAHWAGTGVGQARALGTAELVRDLVRELQENLNADHEI